jgi:hypothetical protein
MRADGSQREIRFSLRTTDPGEARILALEFNLALERVRAATRAKHRSASTTAPLTVTIGETQWNIREQGGRSQFDQLLRDRPELRQALLATVEDGVAPIEAAAALVQQATPTTMSVAHTANPVLLKTAIELFEQSRPTLNGNRRGTASEKRRTMDLLHAHLIAHRHPSQTIYVHDVRRDELVDFVTEYASRPAKASGDGVASKTKPFVHGANGNDAFETLSPRTVIKAIGHLENFYAYAVGKAWVASNPMDAAFHGATEGLRKGAASAKRANSYECRGHARTESAGRIPVYRAGDPADPDLRRAQQGPCRGVAHVGLAPAGRHPVRTGRRQCREGGSHPCGADNAGSCRSAQRVEAASGQAAGVGCTAIPQGRQASASPFLRPDGVQVRAGTEQRGSDGELAAQAQALQMGYE